MKYFLIAGELSGDIHGAMLIKHLQDLDKEASFAFFGGDKMKAQYPEGLKKHINELSFMGFIEVVKHLKTILKNIAYCKQQIDLFKPDVMIFIDFPGFNLRLARYTFKRKIKNFYYISPQIWAWKKKRIKKIKRLIDNMYVILPFEKAFYQKENYEVHYFGNPILDWTMHNTTHLSSPPKIKNKIALVPGSRKQEIDHILPIMVSVAEQFPDYSFIITAVSHITLNEYKKHTVNQKNISIKYDDFDQILPTCVGALVTSGTATLQTALYGVPQVVCYKTSSISYHIAKALINVKYISLVNLILNREAVPELIQDKLNTIALKKAFTHMMSKENTARITRDYKELYKQLGDGKASEKICAHIYQSLCKT